MYSLTLFTTTGHLTGCGTNRYMLNQGRFSVKTPPDLLRGYIRFGTGNLGQICDFFWAI